MESGFQSDKLAQIGISSTTNKGFVGTVEIEYMHLTNVAVPRLQMVAQIVKIYLPGRKSSPILSKPTILCSATSSREIPAERHATSIVLVWLCSRSAFIDGCFAFGFRSGRLDFFTIHKIYRMDGLSAFVILVYCDYFWIAVSANQFFSHQDTIKRWPECLDNNFSAHFFANDDRNAPHHWQGRHIFSDREKVFCQPLV
jgi:hypothetical protein